MEQIVCITMLYDVKVDRVARLCVISGNLWILSKIIVISVLCRRIEIVCHPLVDKHINLCNIHIRLPHLY